MKIEKSRGGGGFFVLVEYLVSYKLWTWRFLNFNAILFKMTILVNCIKLHSISYH